MSDMCASGLCFFFFQAEDGIRDLVRSRGLGDVYKRQDGFLATPGAVAADHPAAGSSAPPAIRRR